MSWMSDNGLRKSSRILLKDHAVELAALRSYHSSEKAKWLRERVEPFLESRVSYGLSDKEKRELRGFLIMEWHLTKEQ